VAIKKEQFKANGCHGELNARGTEGLTSKEYEDCMQTGEEAT
jgi:hypothetical protein